MERLPFVPKGIHDGALFVDPARLRVLCQERGVDLAINGLRPRVRDVLQWVLHQRKDVRMVSSRWTGAVYQGVGVKR